MSGWNSTSECCLYCTRFATTAAHQVPEGDTCGSIVWSLLSHGSTLRACGHCQSEFVEKSRAIIQPFYACTRGGAGQCTILVSYGKFVDGTNGQLIEYNKMFKNLLKDWLGWTRQYWKTLFSDDFKNCVLRMCFAKCNITWMFDRCLLDCIWICNGLSSISQRMLALFSWPDVTFAGMVLNTRFQPLLLWV